MHYKLLYLILLTNIIVNNVNCAKILGLFPSPSKSHVLLGQALLKTLANYGHEVTMVAPYPLKNVPPNYRQIEIKTIINTCQLAPQTKVIRMLDDFAGNPIRAMFNIYQLGTEVTEKSLEDAAVQNLLKSGEQYDIVISQIFLNEAYLAFAQHFNAIPVAFSTFGPTEWTNDLTGNPSPYSYAPQFFLGLTDHMTFFERLLNTYVSISIELLLNFYHLPKQEALRQKYLPHTSPLPEILKNVSLVFLNSHPSLTHARPIVPNVVEIGGFHIRAPEPLPADLNKILDESKNGVIYFSLGTNLRSTQLPNELKNEILTAFGKLKQTVLWKWDESNLPNQPKNVIIRSWFPQSDILAHSNVKIFITHGGLLSTTEAITRGVPLIGIPIFADQKLNMRQAQTFNYAVVLDLKNITTESLLWAVNEVLNNPNYVRNIQERSSILNDRPVKISDEINYWIEYVVRHKGATHLRTARNDLKLHQYLLLDLIAFILTISGLIIIIIFVCIKFLLKKLLPVKKQTEIKSKIN